MIHPGTSVRNTVTGHHAESSHCICCIMMAPTDEPSRLYCSGTVISMDIAVPMLACRSTVSGMSWIITSVLLPASLLMSRTWTQSSLSERT